MLRFEIKIYSTDNDLIGSIAEDNRKKITNIFCDTSIISKKILHDNLGLNNDIEIDCMILFDNKNNNIMSEYIF